MSNIAAMCLTSVAVCMLCEQVQGVGGWHNWRLCRLLAHVCRRIKSTLSARLIIVLFYCLSLNTLPVLLLISCQAESLVLQYWPVCCLMALSSINLFLGTSCYVKLVLMVLATVSYNVVCYVTSGHVFHSDSSSSTQ